MNDTVFVTSIFRYQCMQMRGNSGESSKDTKTTGIRIATSNQ